MNLIGFQTVFLGQATYREIFLNKIRPWIAVKFTEAVDDFEIALFIREIF